LFRSYASIWIGKERERQILKQLLERHLSQIVALAAMLKDFVQAFLSNNPEDMEKAFKEIFRIEREADDEKESIIMQLSKGPFHPLDREDIMRLVLTMDDIADNIKASSRKLQYADPNIVPDEVKKGITELANMLDDIVISFGEALKGLIEGSKDILN